MLTNFFYAVMMLVVAVALVRGGRPHRRVGLTIFASNVVNGVIQAVDRHHFPALAYLAIDLMVLMLLLRTWRFRPQVWSAFVWSAQLVVIVLDGLWLSPFHPRKGLVYDHLVYALAYLQLCSLLAGVLATWLGPPHRKAT